MGMLETIESVADPLSFASLAGLERMGRAFLVPGYGRVFPVGRVFVSAMVQDRVFRAGSVVDAAALLLRSREGGESKVRASVLYSAAVNLVCNLYSDRLPHIHDTGREEAAREALDLRVLRDFFLSRPASRSPGESSDVTAGRRAVPDSYDPLHFPRGLQAMTKDECGRLFELLDHRFGIEVSLHVKRYVVRPWFSDPCTPVLLELFEKYPSLKPPSKIHLGSAGVLYSGLGDMDPEKPCYLSDSPHEAHLLMAELLSSRADAQAFGVRHDPSAGMAGVWIPPEARFIYSPGNPQGLAAPLALAREGSSISVMPYGEAQLLRPSAAVPIAEFVPSAFVASAAYERGISSGMESMLRASRMDASMRDSIAGRLRAAGLDHLVPCFTAMFPDRIVVASGGLTVFESAARYRFSRDKSPPEDLTNFTLALSHNVAFRDIDDLYHVGEVVMSRRRFPIMVRPEDLENPNRLDKAAKKADMLASDQSRDLPAIFSPADAKALCIHLRKEAATLPVREGVSFLGWNVKRSSYQGPGFRVDHEGFRPAQGMPHPRPLVLKSYVFGAVEAGGDPAIPEDACAEAVQLLLASAAFIGRAFTGLPGMAFPVRNTPEARAFLAAAFRPLGQVEPIRLPRNLRAAELDGISGFPAYAEGYTARQTEATGLSVFMLGETGMQVSCEVPGWLPGALGSVVSRMVLFYLGEPLSGYASARALTRTDRLLREGASELARAGISVPWTYRKRMPALETLLEGLSFEEMSEALAYNHETQETRLEAGKAAEKVAAELQRPFEGSVVDADAAVLFPLLANWYGQAPACTLLAR
jgi:hypothetical protein